MSTPRGGKSTFTQILKGKGIVDPDRTLIISSKLFHEWEEKNRAKKQGVSHPENTDALRPEYHDAVVKLIEAALKKRISITIEDQADQPEWLNKIVQLVNTNGEGYDKILLGIAQDRARYFIKMKEREESGKQADHPRTLNAFKTFSSNWDAYSGLFTDSLLYFRAGYDVPKLLAWFSNHGEAKSIYDAERYEHFRNQRNLDTSIDPEKAWDTATGVAEPANQRRGLAEGNPPKWQQIVSAIDSASGGSSLGSARR